MQRLASRKRRPLRKSCRADLVGLVAERLQDARTLKPKADRNAAAREAIDAVLGALLQWVFEQLRYLPTGQRARLTVAGFGGIEVTVQPRGRRNAAKLLAGEVQPSPVTARVTYEPSRAVLQAIKRRNRLEREDAEVRRLAAALELAASNRRAARCAGGREVDGAADDHRVTGN